MDRPQGKSDNKATLEDLRELRASYQTVREISDLLRTGLSPEMLAHCLALLEDGANPEVLARIVAEMCRESDRLENLESTP